MTPPTSDAYYNPLLNEIVFPAGILQPPAFSMEAVDAVNYGAIGVVIGHEISHGFDDQGAQFDAQGRLKNWWTDEDLKKFQERGQCVVEQFEGYFIEPGIHHNGKLVLGESIGDLAGAKIAYRAFQISQRGKPPAPTIDGFTPEQQFFIAWGQFRGDAVRPESRARWCRATRTRSRKYRVIGPLSNLPEFQQAFSVQGRTRRWCGRRRSAARCGRARAPSRRERLLRRNDVAVIGADDGAAAHVAFERRQRIAAEQPERVVAAELVPQLLEADRRPGAPCIARIATISPNT